MAMNTRFDWLPHHEPARGCLTVADRNREGGIVSKPRLLIPVKRFAEPHKNDLTPP
jgi:hypothetical protein